MLSLDFKILGCLNLNFGNKYYFRLFLYFQIILFFLNKQVKRVVELYPLRVLRHRPHLIYFTRFCTKSALIDNTKFFRVQVNAHFLLL